MITDKILLLPLSESVLQTAVEQPTALSEDISHAEVAALVLIQHLPSFQGKHFLVLEKKLAEIVAALVSAEQSTGENHSLVGVLSTLDGAALACGRALLPTFSFGLMRDEEVAEADYLLESGCWDFGFRERLGEEVRAELVRTEDTLGATRFLSSEQSRYFREISAQSDDHIHIQGYAGTGKSTLIKSLLGLYESSAANVLVLADTRRQMQSLSELTEGMTRVTVSTFGTVASDQLKSGVAPCQNSRMQWWDTSPGPTPDAFIIEYLGIRDSGELTKNRMVLIVRATVFSFCISADAAVIDHHIPSRFRGVLDHTSRAAVLAYAAELWKAYVSRSVDKFKPKIRSYHQLKWLALNSCGAPRQFTHIIVDECHDLSAAKLCFLESGGQAVISVGDEYQNLQGAAEGRTDVTRHRIMHQSVRSSAAIESIVNPIIQRHSAETKDVFVGNADVAADVTYYSGPSVFPEVPSLLLVKNSWGAFDWLERANNCGVKYGYLGSFQNLNAFVTDCIELYCHGTRARHGELFRFSSWRAVASFYAGEASFERVQKLLSKGYSQRDWQSTQGAALNLVSNDVYTISSVETAKNHEFHRVFLTENIGFDAKLGVVDSYASAIYLAVTRAQLGLTAPQALRDWVEEISASKEEQSKDTNHRRY